MTYTPVLPIPDIDDPFRTRQPFPPLPRSPEETADAVARWTDPLTFLVEHWIGEPDRMRVTARRHPEITAAESAVLHVPEGTPAWYRLGSMVPASWWDGANVLPVALTGLLLLPCRLPAAVVEALDDGDPLGRILARAGREAGMPVSRVHHGDKVTPATEHATATAETSALIYLGAALVALTWEKFMPWLWDPGMSRHVPPPAT